MISNVRNGKGKVSMLPIALIFCVGTSWASSWKIEGRVIRVADGDTLTIQDAEGAKTRVRVADIDAPEEFERQCAKVPKPEGEHCVDKPGQPFSRASKNNLARVSLGKFAIATCREIDRWKRPDCRVVIDGVDLSVEQVVAGLAWYDDRYGRDENLKRLADQAKRDGLGIFSDKDAIRPRVWRRQCWDGGKC